MATKEDMENLEENILALFNSILDRVNEKRKVKIKIDGKAKEKAISGYVKDHPNDKVIFGDEYAK